MVLVRFLGIFLLLIIGFISLQPSFGESVSLDRSVYPIPTEGNPLTIYVTSHDEVTISVWYGSNVQVLGTTSSGVFTIHYDDFDFVQGGFLKAEYLDEYDYASFDDRQSSLNFDQPVYVTGDTVVLTLIDPDLDLDSKNVETYSANDIVLSFNAGTILLNDPIFALTMFEETGNRTGVFSATMKIPEKIGQYDIHSGDKITLKPTGGYESTFTITDAIVKISLVFSPNEISVDIGDEVTWLGISSGYTITAGDPDVDNDKLGVLYPYGFNSGIIEKELFSHKFDVAGEFPYFDELNPQRKGTIIVGGLYGIPNDSITSDSQDSSIINCSVDTYLVDGVCKPRPDLIETTSVSITSAEPKILNTNNERISIAHVGETLFVGVEIENLGDKTEDFVASYRYLASSVGDWSEWTWVSSTINSGKYSDVAIPWNPTLVDNYEFDIQIWDNIQEKNIIAKERLIVTVKPEQTASPQIIQEASPELTSKEPVKEKVPGWIKNNAKWWSEGQIDDDTFVSGIQFLMKEKIVDIPDLPEQASEKARPSFVDESKDPQSYVDRYNNEESYKEWFDENYPDYTIEEAVGVTTPIPGWIKNNAKWWNEGLITEDDFVKGLQFLIKEGIIQV